VARQKTALVIGATGVVGRNLIRHLDGLPDWEILGVARRPLDFKCRARIIQVDLLDPAAAQAALGGLKQVTHIFYAGYTERPSWVEQEPPNRVLLVNAIEAVEPMAKGLRHVCLLQGTKYYGSHLGPFRTPAREDDPRHVGPNF
jgi:nucleoside-diphosphate-sugar epimerase